MDSVLNFLANYHLVFLIISVVLFFALIGFIVIGKKKSKEEGASQVEGETPAAPENATETASVFDDPNVATPSVPVEPVAPSVSETPSMPETPVAPNEPTLIIPDPATQAAPETPVVSETPVAPEVPQTPVDNSTNNQML